MVRLFSALLMLVAAVAGAAPAQFPILGRVIGGVGENGETLPGVSKRCFIYPTQAVIQTYNAATGKSDGYVQPLNLTSTYLRQVSQALELANRQRETAQQRAQEVLPHVYYFGYPTQSAELASTRVRLFFDGARRIERPGQEAPQLLQIIEQICPHR